MEENKDCPFCKSKINKMASVCPHCGRDISTSNAIISLIQSILWLSLTGIIIYLFYQAIIIFL